MKAVPFLQHIGDMDRLRPIELNLPVFHPLTDIVKCNLEFRNCFFFVASIAISTVLLAKAPKNVSSFVGNQQYIVDTRKVLGLLCGTPADIGWNAENTSSCATLNVLPVSYDSSS